MSKVKTKLTELYNIYSLVKTSMSLHGIDGNHIIIVEICLYHQTFVSLFLAISLYGVEDVNIDNSGVNVRAVDNLDDTFVFRSVLDCNVVFLVWFRQPSTNYYKQCEIEVSTM